MQVILYDQTFACENDMLVVEQLFQRLSQIIAENGHRIICLELDGIEVYTDYNLYIANHLNSIQSVFIRVGTEQEILGDSLLSVKEYVERAVPEINKLVDQFYHEDTSQTWNTFAQLLEGLQYIMGTLEAVVQHADWFFNGNQLRIEKDNLSKAIIMLQNAAESQDRVWLCDVLLYEIIPVFQSLSLAINLNFKNGNVQ